MIHSFLTLLQTSVMERLTLLANHVISGEPVASDKLLAHAGRTFSLELVGWPKLLPTPPAMAFLVTPAGLLEWVGADAAVGLPDLRLFLDASNPARVFGEMLKGERPRIDIDGDAALAADLGWLMENLRWDVTDDLARIVGPGPAGELSRVLRALSGGIRQAADALRAVTGKIVSAAAPGRSGEAADEARDGSRFRGEAGRTGR